ncbi:hypothetical protein [Ottowia testudinis]|uniref:Uncharacterized protein n=1 Tax=Ottowia testudinis TaxID=2816950 RepID=A0A975H2A4_9BURK|nr:hypothetical protein [Ottowia testudinis]QTD44658.1 hypothetical protein J1M35_16430 [Ottowia testudinis]
MRTVLLALGFAACVGALGAGCAATSAGPVAGFDGSWTISKRGLVVKQAETLTQAAVREATAFCAAEGKQFRQIDLKESPAGTLSPQAESALTFGCDPVVK